MAGLNDTPPPLEGELPAGAVTKAILDWRPNGVGATPFGGINGPDAASMVLLKAHALIECLASAHGSANEHPESAFGLLADNYKKLALEGVGDLVLFAKLLVDEH